MPNDIGPVFAAVSAYVDDYDPPFPNRLYDFARTHDAEDAARDALVRRAFAALLKTALHGALCLLCGESFGHSDACLIPELCPHDKGTYPLGLIKRTARFCNVCNKEIPQ